VGALAGALDVAAIDVAAGIDGAAALDVAVARVVVAMGVAVARVVAAAIDVAAGIEAISAFDGDAPAVSAPARAGWGSSAGVRSAAHPSRAAAPMIPAPMNP
jgi:hypothetical protein